MVLEHIILDMKPGQEENYEAALAEALPLIAESPGLVSLRVQRCLETPSRYLLMIEWETLEDHTVKFRNSERYLKWRDAIAHHYETPVVQHFLDPIAEV